MIKKYVVRLSEEERGCCQAVVKILKGSSEKVRRAQILLKADADGPNWPDAKIAEAFDCRVQTIEKIRQRLVQEGFDKALERKKRAEPPIAAKLDGQAEAKLIALRLGKPPTGFGHWTLRLLAEELVALEVVDSISHETIRRTLKKRHDKAEDRVLGDSARTGCRVCRGHGGRAGNLCPGVRFPPSGFVHG